MADNTEPTGPHIDKQSVVELRDNFAPEKTLQEFKLGRVGRTWGDRYEKPGNISAVALMSLIGIIAILLLFSFFFGGHPYFKDTLTALVSIITLILGYLFGSSDAPPRE